MANYRVKVVGDAPAEADPASPRKVSFFGHDPALKGLVPEGHELPAHLVLTLDNADPRIAALGIDVGPKVRLVHPFRYSEGDFVAYRHRGGDAIEFIGAVEAVEQPWPSDSLPETFPARAIEIAAIEGEPRREFGECSTIYLGGNAPTAQRHGDGGDGNGDDDGGGCAACSTGVPRLIASVPSRPVPGLDIWDNDFVFALFWFCDACKAITTHNECD